MSRYARAGRFMVIGWVLMGLGLVLLILKIGFDVRTIDDWDLIVTFAGVGLTIAGSRRRREEEARWTPPVEADRFH